MTNIHMQSEHLAAVVMSRKPAPMVIRDASGVSGQSGEIPELRFSDVGRVGGVGRELLALTNERP